MIKYLTFSVVLLMCLSSCRNENNVVELTDVTIRELSQREHVNLHDLCVDYSYIKLHKIQPEFNSFRINKICFTKKYLIVLWENSNKVSIFNRDGNHILDVSDLLSQTDSFKSIDLKCDFALDILYILIEGNQLLVLKLDSQVEKFKIISEIFLGSVEVNEIIKIPECDAYALSTLGFTSDFAMVRSLPIRNNNLFAQKIVSSRYNKYVKIKNSFLSDGNDVYYMKYQNDTIYLVGCKGITPKFAFNFSGLNLREISDTSNYFKQNAISNTTILAFNIVKDNYILKYSVDSEIYYLFKTVNNGFINVNSTNIVNNIFGSKSLNCIGIDQFSGSFAFQIPSNTLKRFRNKEIDIIEEDTFVKIDSLRITENETPIVILLKLK